MEVELYHPKLKTTIRVDARSARIHRLAGWRDVRKPKPTTVTQAWVKREEE